MPISFDVRASTGSYGVAIAPGLLDAMLADGGERIYIVDDRLQDHVRAAGIDPVTIIADEYAKSLDRMTDLIVMLRERRVTRQATLVAVGGGVIQDIAAFAASIYMRGIPWVYVPTTLLSMTDSCIGGKSSINVGRYKNIVGTFHPPTRIVIDPAFVRTLSAEQKAAGLCEAAKITYCRGAEAFAEYLALRPTIDTDEEGMSAIIALSLGAKTWFVEIDEFDKNERLLLNLGHTFGHAIEAASEFRISHGIAVGLGVLAALNLGEAMGRDYSDCPRAQSLRAHMRDLLACVGDLDDIAASVPLSGVMDAFGSDKKHVSDRFTAILVTEAGGVERAFLPRDAETGALIERAFAETLHQRAPHVAA